MIKKNTIAMVIILIILTLGLILICCQDNDKNIALEEDMMIAVVIDNESSSTLPATGGYKADITCNNASAVWKYNTNNDVWEIELSNINGNVSCNAIFTDLTDDYLVVNFIENLLGTSSSINSGNGYLVDEEDAGYRYEGANPDNYVWFNNEMWRIIGVISTKTSNGVQDLAKIIRADSIGNYAYDGVSSSYTGLWGSNTLYTLLNSYYWEKTDGTGTEYCMYTSSQSAPNCDFTVKGIGSDTYYGNMVEYVYWNNGLYDYTTDNTPFTIYENEISVQNVGGYVGIMNASDFGYAGYNIGHSISVGSYSSVSDWLNKNFYEYTMTRVIYDYNTYYISSGSLNFYSVINGYAVRPVVYLNSTNVYIVDGDGSESDPYILGTN